MDSEGHVGKVIGVAYQNGTTYALTDFPELRQPGKIAWLPEDIFIRNEVEPSGTD